MWYTWYPNIDFHGPLNIANRLMLARDIINLTIKSLQTYVSLIIKKIF